MHYGSVHQKALAQRGEAAAAIGGFVVVANDVPKLDRAGLIPSEDLPSIGWQTRPSKSTLGFCFAIRQSAEM